MFASDLAFEPTSSPNGTEGEDTPSALPFALIFSFGVIGALFLLVLVLIGVTVTCCVVKQMRASILLPDIRPARHTSQVLIGDNAAQVSIIPPSGGTVTQDGQDNATKQTHRPHYTEVVKLKKAKVKRESDAYNDDGESSPPPPLPPPPMFTTPSPEPAPKPQEIMSYNMEIPNSFIPYAPPPPISGLASSENLHKIDTSQNPYDIPVDSLADYDEVDSFDGLMESPTRELRKPSRTMSLQSYPSRQYQSQSEDDGYYDQVESVHRDSPSGSLTSSFHISNANRRVSEGHYQSPRRRRAGRYSQGNNPPYNFEPTFIEALEPSMLHSSLSSIGSEAPLPYAPIYDCPRSLTRSEQPLEISCHNIMEIRDLGKGRFGPIVLAATVNLTLKDLNLGNSDEKSRSFLVAVKKLKKDADSTTKNAFQEEIRFLSALKHANVVRLLGVCSMPASPFIIVEYMENGDLHSFLQKQKLVADNTQHLEDGEATPLILLYMAVQISSGMRYLASRKFIHRDLATRNCLVGKEFVVKISDFGMSENLYESYYYRVQGQLILPIRWMPYESFYGKFSIKSDVWAFGVTLWEIYCMAEREPYTGMTNEELIHDATKGHKRTLLKRPEICPQEVYDIMMRCWVHEPSVRADFEEIYSRLFLAYMNKSQAASN